MREKTSLLLLLIYLLSGIFFISNSCKTQISGQLTRVPVSLKIICNNPKQYLNREVDLEGTFSGWSGKSCNFIENLAHQLTRSDWIFCDSEMNSIYVTGGKPDFLDPLRKEDLGEKIQLKAILLQDSGKKYYLKYISAFKLAENK